MTYPILHQAIRQLFAGKNFCSGINPQEAVALGAAIYANQLTLSRDPKLEDFLLLNISWLWL